MTCRAPEGTRWRTNPSQAGSACYCPMMSSDTWRGARVLEPLPLDGAEVRHPLPPVIAWHWQIYRVGIKPTSKRHVERFAYIEAGNEPDACSRVATAAAALDCCRFDDALARVAAKSYDDCCRVGVSDDPELRLFELGWTHGSVTTWVCQPIFLLPRPYQLTLKWASVLRTLLQ